MENRYSKIYFAIIDRRRMEDFLGYTEVHHIIPRSIGGSDDADNLVRLSAKEHYICHLLLTKMYDGKERQKMIYAFICMSNLVCRNHNRSHIRGAMYAILKEEAALLKSRTYTEAGNPFYGKTHSVEAKNKISNRVVGTATREAISSSKRGQKGSFKDRQHSDDTKRKMSKIAIDSERWKSNFADARKFEKGNIPSNKGIPMSNETKNKISMAMTGEANPFFRKKHSEETRAKMSASHNAEPKKLCYYCQHEVDSRNFGRWHGEKCKSRRA